MILILKNKFKIEDLQISGTLKESIDSVAYSMNITILKNYELANKIGLTKGDAIEFWDKNYNSSDDTRFFCGYIYGNNESDKTRRLDLDCKERTFRMEESDDELRFNEGETASQRIVNMCNDWGIPIGNIQDTGIGLAKDLKKTSLYSMMWGFLKETAQKGGKLYNFRFDESLNVVEVGSNATVYVLDDIIDEPSRNNTLQGAVTQVKVLGENKSKGDNPELSPVIGTFSQYTDDYGTIQKTIQDSKVADYSQAQKKANSMFSSGEDTWTFKCVRDILDIRAGDKVSLSGNYYYVTDIVHNLGDMGMTIKAMNSLDSIRSKFYGE